MRDANGAIEGESSPEGVVPSVPQIALVHRLQCRREHNAASDDPEQNERVYVFRSEQNLQVSAFKSTDAGLCNDWFVRTRLQGGMQIKPLGVQHFGVIGIFGERRKEAVPPADLRKTRPEADFDVNYRCIQVTRAG